MGRACSTAGSSAVVKTWTHEGVYGFYKGCLPNAIRVAPGAAVTFFTYETVADVLRK